jgi:predicted hydrocarbon binding protein
MPPTNRQHPEFKWKDLGDIEKGRPNLGAKVPVLAYRLMQYTIRDVLAADFGAETTNAILVKAGRLAGTQFCENMLDRQLGFNEFISQLQRILKEQAIGILRVENVDLDSMRFILTVAEDLDCSGLPCTDEVVCQYDEGFIAGILEAYTGKDFLAKEIVSACAASMSGWFRKTHDFAGCRKTDHPAAGPHPRKNKSIGC